MYIDYTDHHIRNNETEGTMEMPALYGQGRAPSPNEVVTLLVELEDVVICIPATFEGVSFYDPGCECCDRQQLWVFEEKSQVKPQEGNPHWDALGMYEANGVM